MSKVLISVCSRTKTPGSSLEDLRSFIEFSPENLASELNIMISFDAKSIYEGHKSNVLGSWKDDDILVLCHDDISILSSYKDFLKYLEICKKPGVGIVGVAGCTTLNERAIWWESRADKMKSRGFVFQSDNTQEDPSLSMKPNYFGECGQVVALDGCFMAATIGTWKKIGLDQPSYLSSGWDFYDIHLSLTSHLMGLNNYVVPIIVRHGSPGLMRSEWYASREQFVKHHNLNLPCILNKEKTNGLPS